MSEPENFLGRWSRRKLDPEQQKDSAAAPDKDLPPESAETEAVAVDAAQGERLAKKDGKPEEPAFDLSKLPSIDSITATTDIRMFMLPGVPMALRQAALRKVWVADPKIRDFIEMAENQWDFTVNSPGFDFSPPSGDIRKMVAEIFGDDKKEESGKEPAVQPATAEMPEAEMQSAETESVEATQSVRLSARENDQTEMEIDSIGEKNIEPADSENIASQNNDAAHIKETTEYEVPKRRHGSALPG